jgi:hypothetical protein
MTSPAMDRKRVEAHLHDLERLIDDPPPLLSLVILENGRGLMVAHPLLIDATATPEQYAAALGLIRAQLLDLARHFEQQIERSKQFSEPR